jgi:hypothetical protein
MQLHGREWLCKLDDAHVVWPSEFHEVGTWIAQIETR